MMAAPDLAHKNVFGYYIFFLLLLFFMSNLLVNYYKWTIN